MHGGIRQVGGLGAGVEAGRFGLVAGGFGFFPGLSEQGGMMHVGRFGFVAGVGAGGLGLAGVEAGGLGFSVPEQASDLRAEK